MRRLIRAVSGRPCVYFVYQSRGKGWLLNSRWLCECDQFKRQRWFQIKCRRHVLGELLGSHDFVIDPLWQVWSRTFYSWKCGLVKKIKFLRFKIAKKRYIYFKLTGNSLGALDFPSKSDDLISEEQPNLMHSRFSLVSKKARSHYTKMRVRILTTFFFNSAADSMATFVVLLINFKKRISAFIPGGWAVRNWKTMRGEAISNAESKQKRDRLVKEQLQTDRQKPVSLARQKSLVLSPDNNSCPTWQLANRLQTNRTCVSCGSQKQEKQTRSYPIRR